MRKNIKNLTLEELKRFYISKEIEPYRSDQIFHWIWVKDKSDFKEITSLSKTARLKFDTFCEIPILKTIKKLTSKDRTVKFLFGLHDRKRIESVYIPTKKRKTVCISTQVGCALNCSFCMTGKTGFKRNLAAWEIVDQVRRIQSEMGKRLTNVVLMGMGEPLLNYNNVMKGVKILNSDMGMNIGARKITISTAGIVPGIRALGKEPLQVKLAVSLNAATDKKRDRLMPINRRYNLNTLFKALEFYYEKKKKRITFEYVLIKGVNDSITDAKALAAITQHIPCKINIIPLNSIGSSSYRSPDMEKVKKFIEFLYPIAQAVTLRQSRGNDIHGACGQLRSKR